MFNPFAKINLQINKNEVQYISKYEMNKNLTSSIFANFFQTSLQLDWYKICLKNLGAVTMDGQTVINDNDKSGDVQTQVKEIASEPYSTSYKILYASPLKKKNCIRINSDINGILVGSTTVAIGYSTFQKYDAKAGTGPHEYSITFKQQFSKTVLYIEQDWVMLITKYLVIVLLWSALILLIREIAKFLRIK
jgi:hypothetical protein